MLHGVIYECDLEVNDALACMGLRWSGETPEEALTSDDPYYAELQKRGVAGAMIWVEIP
jgi:hypothetical protein